MQAADLGDVHCCQDRKQNHLDAGAFRAAQLSRNALSNAERMRISFRTISGSSHPNLAGLSPVCQPSRFACVRFAITRGSHVLTVCKMYSLTAARYTSFGYRRQS